MGVWQCRTEILMIAKAPNTAIRWCVVSIVKQNSDVNFHALKIFPTASYPQQVRDKVYSSSYITHPKFCSTSQKRTVKQQGKSTVQREDLMCHCEFVCPNPSKAALRSPVSTVSRTNDGIRFGGFLSRLSLLRMCVCSVFFYSFPLYPAVTQPWPACTFFSPFHLIVYARVGLRWAKCSHRFACFQLGKCFLVMFCVVPRNQRCK